MGGSGTHTHRVGVTHHAAGIGRHIHIRLPQQLAMGAHCVQGLSPLSSLQFWPAHYQPAAVGQVKETTEGRRKRGTAYPKLTVTMSNN